MKHIFFILALILCTTIVHAQSDELQIGGYLQGMPVRIGADLPEPIGSDALWEYRLQNRLNLNWYITSDITVNWEMRTRFFAGDLVEEIPFYADAIDRDPGYVDLSWMIVENESILLHYIPDRLNIDWYTDDWRVTAGRQRINWGINTVSNPNDLFNIYSFYDFDYPERPGTDAIRAQYFIDWASRVEFAYSPARDSRNSVASGMYTFNTRGYDIQLITGYYRHRWAAGGGWAGSIRQTGFKGEIMAFMDLDEQSGNRSVNLVAALSADHMFENSLFLVTEFLYNKNGGRDQFLLLGEPLSADNPSFSRYQFTVQGSYPFSPILNGSLAGIYYPDEFAAFLSPSITWSVLQDLDFNILLQIFAGSEDSAFSNAGNVAAGSLKWYF
ncbi:hypothetical protein [Rhodohalobacter sp. 8-1]|uniref:hypothetical protein n=1 Tax=Rhodohalobacter sp. 8-1 TaxID=3131972 RepID=UPI0030EC30F1